MATFKFSYKFFSLIYIYLNLQLITVYSSEVQQYKENHECHDMLPQDYRKYEVPVIKGDLTKVRITFLITNLDDIDESNMDFRLHGYYNTFWKDSRLVMNGNVVINSGCAEFIWVPKVIFTAAESKEIYDFRENVITIYKNQRVQYAQRFGFRVGCKMFFKDYPFDSQFCKFPMRLLDSVLSNVSLKWFKENGTKSVSLAEEFKPLQFFLRQPTALTDEEGVSIQFEFVRQWMGSFINIFVPSTLIVAVSWVSFWIRVEAAPARVSLSVTSLLTLCTQVQSHRSQLPKLNYIIALDIWLFVCIFMVFATLVEFAISYNSYVTRSISSARNRRQIPSAQDKENGAWIANMEEGDTNSQGSSTRFKFCRYRRWFCSPAGRNVTKIDRACRIFFPLSFTVFAVAYWAHYLTIYRKEI